MKSTPAREFFSPVGLPLVKIQPDLALGEDILSHPRREEVAARKIFEIIGLDVEDGQVRVADLAVELAAENDRDLVAFVEPDLPADEGDEADARAEAEDLRTLEEEHPLFGKNNREPGQVDAALIDLGLGEVHVDSWRRRPGWG